MKVFAYDGIFHGAPILHEMAHPFHRHQGSGNNGNVKPSLSPKNKTPAKHSDNEWTNEIPVFGWAPAPCDALNAKDAAMNQSRAC